MTLVRIIGRGAMTALVINCIIGSGIFGVPSELIRLLGRASPLVMIVAALAMSTITLSLAEVASQFTEPGGIYLYARTAFGRLIGLQVGWFWLLAVVGGGAAGANLFISYLSTFFPAVGYGWRRLVTLVILIAVPTVANYLGVRTGIRLSNLLTISKLLPLAILILIGLLHFHRSGPFFPATQILLPGAGAWLKALLLLVYSYGGYEDALVPMGEVKQPRQTVPFALGIGLFICMLVYTLLQFVIVSTIGVSPTDRPLVETASVLIGQSGASVIALTVMFSTYGWISTGFLSAPRFMFSLARQDDCPAFLGKLHPRFHTPSVGILLYALLVSLLAITGTFLWVLSLTAGSMMILYAVGCATLIRLRRSQPEAPALRVPFGSVFAMLGIAISIVLITQLEKRQVLWMCITASIGGVNWWWAKRHSEYRLRSASRDAGGAAK